MSDEVAKVEREPAASMGDVILRSCKLVEAFALGGRQIEGDNPDPRVVLMTSATMFASALEEFGHRVLPAGPLGRLTYQANAMLEALRILVEASFKAPDA